MDSPPSVLDGLNPEPNNDDSFDLVEIDQNNSPLSSPEQEETLKVMFHGSKSTYRFGELIEISFYSFNNSHIMEPGDRVGIAPLRKTPFISQKIDSASSGSCIDIISDDLIEEDQITAKKLHFMLEELPKEIAEERFFQFCYLNSQGQIIGLSIPFQFLNSNQSSPDNEPAIQDSSVMEIEKSPNYDVHMERQEDDDFIVVRTHENYLKERVKHLTCSNNLIQNLVRSLQIELGLKVSENNNLLAENKRLDNMCKEKIAEFERMIMVTNIEKENIRKSYDLSIEGYKRDLEDNERKLIELKNSVEDREELVKTLTDQLDDIREFVPASKEKDKKIKELKDLLEVVEKDFASYRSKREIEIKDLEANLRKSMDNLKNLNFKYESSQEQFAIKERELSLKLRKEQDRFKAIVVKLEQSKIENSNLNNRVLFYKNQIYSLKGELLKAKNSVNESTSLPSAPPLYPVHTTIEVLKEPLRNEVEERFYNFEGEEKMETQSQTSQLERSYEAAHSENEVKNQNITSDELKFREIPIQVESGLKSTYGQTYPKVLDSESLQGYVSGTSDSSSYAIQGNAIYQGDYQITLPCIFCNKSIQCTQHQDGSGQMREMIDHLEKVHRQKMCPICSTLFDMSLPIFNSYFHNHVQEHIKDTTYPSLES